MNTCMAAAADPVEDRATNRALLRDLGLTAISIISAPRAGNTTILERTLPCLKNEFKVAVIESDLQPSLDALQIRSAGALVWQIITGTNRRPEARTLAEALGQFPLAGAQVLFIERLIDSDESSLPDWGEDLRVIIYRISPTGLIPSSMLNLFRAADAVLVNAMDCLPGARINEDALATIGKTSPDLAVFAVRSPARDDLTEWINWLRQKMRAARCVPARACGT